MKRNDPDLLLGALLAGEECAQLRRSSLESGLAALGRQRRRRCVRRRCVLAGLPVALAFCLCLARAPFFSYTHSPTANRTPPGRFAHAVRLPQIEIITDEQLFALFPGRPMALIGEPGHQQLLLPAEPADSLAEVTAPPTETDRPDRAR